MPLLILPLLLASLVTWLALGAAGYFLWTWSQGLWLIASDGGAYRVREEWRLWAALAILAWSFLGRLIAPLLLARPDSRREPFRHGAGRTVKGVAGAALHVETLGPASGPPIILTHGWGLDSTIWAYAKADLATRFRVTVWDLPGLGRSTPNLGGRVDLRDYAADLAALLPASGAPVVLVGHSIGGMVIQTLTRDHPEALDRVAGIVLLNTTYTNPLKTMVLSRLALALRRPLLEPAMRAAQALQPIVWVSAWHSYLSGAAHVANRLGFGRSVTRRQLDQVSRLSARNPPAIQARGNLAMFDWDATDALARTAVPVLIIGGDLDIVTKLEASQRIAGATPQATLRVVDGVNHLGFLEQSEHYNRLIGDFTLSVQPDAAPAGAGQSQGKPGAPLSPRVA